MNIEQLIDQYSDLVFSVCLKITGNYFDSQDLTQETFLAALRSQNFDGVNPKAWLCRIATNKCLDYLKCAQRRSIPTEGEYFQEIQSREKGTEEQVLEQDIKSQVKDACEKLRPPYDQIALEYFYYEKDAKRIAMERNQNIKTIQTQIYRAKAMLKKIFQPLEKGAGVHEQCESL